MVTLPLEHFNSFELKTKTLQTLKLHPTVSTGFQNTIRPLHIFVTFLCSALSPALFIRSKRKYEAQK